MRQDRLRDRVTVPESGLCDEQRIPLLQPTQYLAFSA